MPEQERADSTDEREEIRARAFWSGTITFGLVSVPVNLFPANRPSRVSLRMLDANGAPLSRRYFSDRSGREIDSDNIIRGFEVEKDEFVPLTDDELEGLAPERTRDIDLRHFVDLDALDPVYFERAYFLTPDGTSNKAYRLMAETMERTGKAGIATFVMRTKEYLVAIIAEEGILRAETLRFPDEIRTPADIGLPAKPRLPRKAVAVFAEEIEKLTESKLSVAEMHDGYAERLLELVETKRKRGEDVVELPEEEEDDDDVRVIDLMEVLKRSLAGERAGPGRAAKDGGDLEALTKKQLYARAQKLDIEGRAQMNKDQLIDALRTA